MNQPRPNPRNGWLALTLIAALAGAMLITTHGPALAQWDREADHDERHERRGWDDHDRRHDRRRDVEAGEREMFEHQRFRSEIRVYQSMLELMDQIADIAADPSKAGVMAVMSAEDRFESPRALAEFLEEMADQTEDHTVRRAIAIKLNEIYGDHDQIEPAREQLRKLILNDF